MVWLWKAGRRKFLRKYQDLANPGDFNGGIEANGELRISREIQAPKNPGAARGGDSVT